MQNNKNKTTVTTSIQINVGTHDRHNVQHLAVILAAKLT